MLLPDARMKRRTAAFLAIAAALVLVGVASSLYVFSQVDRAGRAHILERAATIAIAVPPEDLARISGTEEDLGTPSYESLKSLLMRMRAANHDARFLYLMGRNEAGELFFYADSEAAESPDHSPPGQVYYEATPAMRALFQDGQPRTEGPDRDRWGLWISGYAPVVDRSGEVTAMLGMDLPAGKYLGDALAYAVLPLLVTFALLILLAAAEQGRRRELASLEQKAEFLSIASHEIRTPLTGIRWAIEGLLRQESAKADPRTRTLLELVHESCLGLIGRVNNLLDLTAIEGRRTAMVRPESLPIGPFLRDIADSLALSAKQRGVSLVLDASVETAGTLRADRQMMHHAFFNLLTNAIKYTHEGTEVTVSYEHADGMHAFRVRDRGDGIREEDRERIFEGYRRTKEAVRSGQYGTGLGLYLARKAAELHGGTIRVMSAPGNGATFVLTLPDAP